MKRRVTWILVSGFVALTLLIVYGVGVEPRLLLDSRRYRIGLPSLPVELTGAEISVFSDLQVGMWLANTRMVRRIVDEAVAVHPDAVVIAGNFVYGGSPDVAVQVETVTELLAPLLDSGIPTFAVLGNHDYAAEAVGPLVDALERRGVVVLRNESVRLLIKPNEPPLYIVGIDAYRPGLSRPAAAFEAVPQDAPRFVVMHNPASFTAIAANEAPLAVAGHTHCGQVAVPATPTWSHLELRSDERIVVEDFAPAGYGAAGNSLFVTCGIGFSRIPMRISAPPQLVTFELHASS